MFDAMVAKPKIAEQIEGGEIEYWMDVAQEDAQDALKHLKVCDPMKLTMLHRNTQSERR